jgi:hypothetical protein
MRTGTFLLLTALLAGGCALKGNLLQPEEKLHYRTASLEQLLDSLTTGKAGIQNLKASFSALITENRNGTKESCDGMLAMARPDRLRVKASKAMLPTFFDLVCTGSRVSFYVPRERTVYRGHWDTGSAITTLAGLNILMNVFWGTENQSGAAHFLESQETKYVVYTIMQSGGKQRLVSKVYFNRLLLQPDRYQYFDQDGVLIRDIVCADFFAPEGTDTYIPLRISMKMYPEMTGLLLRLRNPRVNIPLNPGLFHLEVPPSVRSRPLEEYLK